MTNTEAPRLTVTDISKRFGATVALEAASLSVRAGEICAIAGESGAGKSTLANIMAGVCLPDSGRMELDGRDFRPRSPREARRAGVAVVSQEPCIAAHLTGEENILLGAEPQTAGFINAGTSARSAAAVMDELGCRGVPLRIPAGFLSLAEQRMLEIARALVSGCRLLILDEPANCLSAESVLRMFYSLKRFSQRGRAIVYASRFPEETRGLAARFIALRDGRVAGEGIMSEKAPGDILAMTLGCDPLRLYHRSERKPGDPVLTAEDLSGGGRVKAADLVLHRGEVFGIAGQTGAGRTELLRLLFSMDKISRGEVRIGMWVGPASPAARLEQGVGMLSEDRRGEGIAAGMSVADNMTLSRIAEFGSFGAVLPRRQGAAAAEWIRRLGIKCRDPWQIARELSCGDRQKVALARLLHQDADILLLDEPTAGVDMAGKADIYRLIDEVACGNLEKGLSPRAVILVSSNFQELLGISDRIAVMARGVLYPARPAGEWTEHRLRMAATGELAA